MAVSVQSFLLQLFNKELLQLQNRICRAVESNTICTRAPSVDPFCSRSRSGWTAGPASSKETRRGTKEVDLTCNTTDFFQAVCNCLSHQGGGFDTGQHNDFFQSLCNSLFFQPGDVVPSTSFAPQTQSAPTSTDLERLDEKQYKLKYKSKCKYK